MPRLSWRSVSLRLVLVGLLLGVYATAWRPARTWIATDIIAPTLRTASPPGWVTSRGVSVFVQRPDTSTSAHFRTPAGLLFLLPALGLILLSPRRPYWLYLWAYQLLFGSMLVGVLWAGLQGSDAFFDLYHFLNGRVYMGTSLAAPLLAFWVEKQHSTTKNP